MRVALKKLLWACGFALPLLAQAYPQFIGLQYTSCLTCHYNPMGNGPLTDYGRGAAATGVAGRFLVGDEKGLEDIAKGANFPGIDPAKNKWLRPMASYRGIAFQNNAFTKKKSSRYINMMLDANVVVKGGERDQYVMSFTYGAKPIIGPGGRDGNNLWESQGYTREHFVGWRPNKAWGVYAGKMDKVFGLRVPDHVAYSRSMNRITPYTTVHGVMVHGMGEKIEGALHAFVGDLNEKDSDKRDKGFSGQFEYNVGARSRLGGSLMRANNKSLENDYIAIHDRTGFGKGHSVMAEVGQGRQKTVATGDKSTNRWGFLQTHLMMRKGLFAMGTFEYWRPDTHDKNENLRAGPGLQWFPRTGWEFRFDLQNTRTVSENSASKDAWQVQGQVHLWL